MYRKLLPFVAFCIMSATPLFAQQNTEVKCKLSVEEILFQQSFDIDEPISEDVRYLTEDLFDALEKVHDLVNSNQTSQLPTQIALIDQIKVKADELSVNYTMFQADFDYVESLK